MNIKLLLILIFFLPQLLFAQDERCGSTNYERLINSQYPQLLTAKKKLKDKITARQSSGNREEGEITYKIPVVVHVIYYNEETNVSEERIKTQIQVLNEDYRKLNADTVNAFPDYLRRAADVNIEFCLATCDPCGNYTTGVNRIFYDRKKLWNGAYDAGDDLTMKSLSKWPSEHYLNIWVADLGRRSGDETINLLGYSSFLSDPEERDGIAVDFLAFGRAPREYRYDRGRTATHEIGHWLGLEHIFGGEGCSDDNVFDTPIQSMSNKNMSISCNPHFSVCNSDGIATRDMHENFMDYSPDRCMSIFTFGQKARMRTTLEEWPRRFSLRNSNGCCTPPKLATYPFKEDFEGQSLSSKGGYTSGRWEVASPGGKGESLNSLKLNKTANDLLLADTIKLPYVQLTEGSQISLLFNYAFAKSLNDVKSDSLIVVVNPGCQDEVVLAKLYGDDLLTTERFGNGFVPLADEWKSLLVDLAQLQSLPFFQLSIINYSKGGSPLYLDDFNIYNSPLSLQLKVFPNPTGDKFNMYAAFRDKRDVTWDLYDLMGHKVKTGSINKTVSFIQDVDTGDLMPGMYILVLKAGEAIEKEKIVIIRP